MSKPTVQLSVTNFHFVKPGLIKHVLLVWMGLKFIFFKIGYMYFQLSEKGFHFWAMVKILGHGFFEGL